MAENEARARLEAIRAGLLGGADVKVAPSEENIKAIDAALDALEESQKRTAMKVISFECSSRTTNYGCPVCRRRIISKIDDMWCAGDFDEYCDRCGQRLDWSDEV